MRRWYTIMMSTDESLSDDGKPDWASTSSTGKLDDTRLEKIYIRCCFGKIKCGKSYIWKIFNDRCERATPFIWNGVSKNDHPLNIGKYFKKIGPIKFLKKNIRKLKFVNRLPKNCFSVCRSLGCDNSDDTLINIKYL